MARFAKALDGTRLTWALAGCLALTLLILGATWRTAAAGLDVEVTYCDSANPPAECYADDPDQAATEEKAGSGLGSGGEPPTPPPPPAGESPQADRGAEQAPPPREVHDYSLETGEGRIDVGDGVEELSLDLSSRVAARSARGRRRKRSGDGAGERVPVSTTGGSPFEGFGAGFDFVSSDEALRRFSIPPFLVPMYVAAGRAYGVPWNLLASINQIETDFGRVRRQVSSAGALGWMQFMPGSWKSYGVDASGDGVADPFNPVDAIYAAARYLRAHGSDTDLRAAVFAYNHADWYVERVLKTASIYGSLPPGLVAATGSVAYGRFPLKGRVRYGDDFRRAQAAGSRPGGLRIFARPGATAVATQNVTVERILLDRRLARAFRSSGGRIAYGRRAAPPPRRTRSAARAAQVLLVRLGGLATGLSGRRVSGPARLAAAIAKAAAPVGRRGGAGLPAGYGIGRQRGISVTVSDAAGSRYRYGGLRRLRPAVRPGGRLTGGQAIGTLPRKRAASLLFAVRGSGGEPLDPRPLVDGYRLQEAADFYHAVAPLGATGNPFVPDSEFIAGTVARGNQRQLARRVLRDPGIQVYPGGREDIRRGVIDRRVLGALLYLSRSGLDLTVTSLRSGHSYYTAGGNVSAHSYGAAVDIAAFNGQPVYGHQGAGTLTEQAIRLLMRLDGAARPAQLISLMEFGGPSFAMADHDDHLHVGYQFQPSLGLGRSGNTLGPVDFAGGGSIDPLAPLKVARRQERDLSRKLGGIENPRVRRDRGRGSLEVESESPGERSDAQRLAERELPLRAEPTAAGARLNDIDVPADARGDEAYAIGKVDGGSRPGWARRQTVILGHADGAWRTLGPPRDARGRIVNPRLRALATVSGGRGYAVGDRGRVVELRGGREPRLLRRVSRSRLGAVDARRVHGQLRGLAAGANGTVVRISGRRSRREQVGGERTRIASLVLYSNGSAVAADARGSERPVIYRRGAAGWRAVQVDFGLPVGTGVRLTSVAAGGRELWVAGAVAESHVLGSPAELPFAARLAGGGWKSFCADAPARAAVAELGEPTGSGCGAGLALGAAERGAATDVAVTTKGVLVATAGGLHLFDSTSFRPVPAVSGPLADLGFSPRASGWALGADGRMTRTTPADKRTASTVPPTVVRLPLTGSGKLAAVAVAPGGDRVLAIGAGDAALFDGRAWRRVDGAGLGLGTAAWPSADRAWAIAETGTLLRFDREGWSAPGEGAVERRARRAVADALGGQPLAARPRAQRHGGLQALAFGSPVEGYAVGARGLIGRFDGRSWKAESSPVTVTLRAVAADRAGVLAAGDRGTLLQRGWGGWLQPAGVRGLVRGRDFTAVDVLADGSALAAAGSTLIEYTPAAGSWQRARFQPLGVPIHRLAGYRDRAGALHALALVGSGDERALLDGDGAGWRPVGLADGARLTDFALDRRSRRLWVVGVRGERPVAARLPLDGLAPRPAKLRLPRAPRIERMLGLEVKP